MDFSWFDLIASFAAGLFGAAIGALPAFILMGLFILLGTIGEFGGSSFDVVNVLGFGPLFGPHISFAGGVAATAYASYKKWVDDGKDILAALSGLNKASVLFVGGLFGSLGYLINIALEPFLGEFTDTIALTVILSAILARIIFGTTGVFPEKQDNKDRGRFSPGGEAVWVEYQQDWPQILTISLGASIISAWLALLIEPHAPESANFVGFGLSALSLIFFQFGGDIPMTHHMTIVAAIAATSTGSLLFGIVMGVLSGVVAEYSSRFTLINGDTHIDPPANAIWIMTTVTLLLANIF